MKRNRDHSSARQQEELEPLDDSLNRSRLKLNLDYRLMIVTFLISFGFFVAHRWGMAAAIFFGTTGISWWLLRKDKKYIDLLLLQFRQEGYYDPGKRK